MSNVGGVVGAPYVQGTTVNGQGLSPDALLAYCQAQMNGLDSQIDTLMSQQETQLNQQAAVQKVQSTLEGFGTNGPQNPGDMQKCVDAYNQAIASLPQGDPVAAQLQSQCDQMESQYGFTPAQTLTPEQQTELAKAQAVVAKGTGAPVAVGGSGITPMADYLQAKTTVDQLTNTQNGVLNNKPANNQWQGNTDSLGNLASDIKSNSEMQMLKLQDLVSQRQDAIQLSTKMMTSTDDTLLDQAKSIGS
jgi:hypothetical protein